MYFCSQYGVPLDILRAYKAEHPSWAKLALEGRRTKYSERTAKIDQALYNKALDGDTKAAELWYKRFDGWSEKAAETIIKNTTIVNFADIARHARH